MQKHIQNVKGIHVKTTIKEIVDITAGFFPRVSLILSDLRRRIVGVATDSIGILVFDKSSGCFWFVTQTRAPILLRDHPDFAETFKPMRTWIERMKVFLGKHIIKPFFEIAAGRIDKKGYTPEMVVADELKEELLCTITEDQIEWVYGGMPHALSAGVITEMMILAYVEIDHTMIEGFKGSETDFVEPEEFAIGDKSEGEVLWRVRIGLQSIVNDEVAITDMKTRAIVDWWLRNKLAS